MPRITMTMATPKETICPSAMEIGDPSGPLNMSAGKAKRVIKKNAKMTSAIGEAESSDSRSLANHSLPEGIIAALLSEAYCL